MIGNTVINHTLIAGWNRSLSGTIQDVGQLRVSLSGSSGYVGLAQIKPDCAAALVLKVAKNGFNLSYFRFFYRTLYGDIDFVSKMIYLCMKSHSQLFFPRLSISLCQASPAVIFS
jgi:hypothetical protein